MTHSETEGCPVETVLQQVQHVTLNVDLLVKVRLKESFLTKKAISHRPIAQTELPLECAVLTQTSSSKKHQ
jgi:hypothetical protein